MRKEVLLAILFGFIIGLIITFGVFTANKSLRKEQAESLPQTAEEVETVPTPTLAPAAITVYEPANQELVDQETVQLRGKALTGAVIAIMTEEDEILIEADDQGLFEAEISLIGGVNQVKITAVNEDGQENETELTIIYSTAEIE